MKRLSKFLMLFGMLVSLSAAASNPCAAVTTMASGAASAKSLDNGATWTAATTPPTFPVTSVSCAGLNCLAIGNSGSTGNSATSSDGGDNWSAGANINFETLTGVSCTSSTCIVVTNDGSIYKSTNFGASFSGVVPSSGNVLNSVSCSGTVCAAVGTSATGFGFGKFTTNLTTWSTSTTPPPGFGFPNYSGVSCVGSLCAAVEYGAVTDAAYSSDSGNNWTATSMPNPYNLVSVSCAGSNCVAVGGFSGSRDLARSMDNGVSWAAASIVISGNMTGVSCVGATCAVISDAPAAAISTNSGFSWAGTTIPTTSPYSSISCTTATSTGPVNGGMMHWWGDNTIPLDLSHILFASAEVGR